MVWKGNLSPGCKHVFDPGQTNGFFHLPAVAKGFFAPYYFCGCPMRCKARQQAKSGRLKFRFQSWQSLGSNRRFKLLPQAIIFYQTYGSF